MPMAQQKLNRRPQMQTHKCIYACEEVPVRSVEGAGGKRSGGLRGGGRTYGVEEFAERFAAPSADKADVKDVVHRRFLLP
jgi:hypothetical protein